MHRYIDTISPYGAQGCVAEVYEQIRRDIGVVPSAARLHSLSAPVLGGAWAVYRETVLAGRVPRALTGLVATTAVSAANACAYCVDGQRDDAVRGPSPGIA
jgi:hypothetical protein